MKFLQVFLIWAENTAFFAPAPPRNRGRRGRGGNRQTPASSAQRQARAIFFIFASLFFAGGVDLQGKRDYNGHVRAGALILPCLKARVRAVRRHIPPPLHRLWPEPSRTSGHLCFGQRFCVTNSKSLSSCVRYAESYPGGERRVFQKKLTRFLFVSSKRNL